MIKFKALVSILISLSIILLSACTGGFGQGVSELSVGIEDIGVNYNPLYASTETEKIISSQIFGSVQRLGTDNSLINNFGGISYEYVGETQVKYTVTLRDDMFYSDGTHVTVDDLIFFYHYIADASYEGPFSDFRFNDIDGLYAYYYDDSDYINSLTAISNSVYELYSPETISKSDFINYLIATKLEGRFINGLDSDSPNGKSWRDYFVSIEYTDELEKLGENPDEIQLLSLAARAEAENNPLDYNPSDYYAEMLVSEYLGSNYSDGIDVPSISGIKKINDYSCTILFNSRNINAISEINIPIMSRAAFEADYIKGNTESVRQKNLSAVGAGPYKLKQTEEAEVTLTVNEFYFDDAPDFTLLRFKDLSATGTGLIEAFLDGEVDIISVDATDSNLKKLKKGDVKTVVSNKTSYISMFFNAERLGLPERKALSGLADFNTFLSNNIGRYYTAVYMPLSIRFPEYPSDVISPVYSASIFDAFVAQNPAGIANLDAYFCGEAESLEYKILGEYKKILSEKGIELTVNAVSQAEYDSAIASGVADIWIESVPDGATCDKYDYFNSVGELNKTGLASAEIDSLTVGLRASVGFSDRKAMTRRILSLVAEQAVENPICQLQTVTAYNTEKISPYSIGNNFDYDGYSAVLTLLKKN